MDSFPAQHAKNVAAPKYVTDIRKADRGKESKY